MPSSDLEELQSAYAEARRFVNKNVAHAEEAAQEGVSPGAMLPMQAIHEPIDVIDRAFSKYSSPFTAAGWASTRRSSSTTGR